MAMTLSERMRAAFDAIRGVSPAREAATPVAAPERVPTKLARNVAGG